MIQQQEFSIDLLPVAIALCQLAGVQIEQHGFIELVVARCPTTTYGCGATPASQFGT
jgi:hypothetical protein